MAEGTSGVARVEVNRARESEKWKSTGTQTILQ